jgi:hypothetical protein
MEVEQAGGRTVVVNTLPYVGLNFAKEYGTR